MELHLLWELKVWQREEGAISWFFTGLRTKGGAMEESFGKAKSSPTQHPWGMKEGSEVVLNVK